MNQIFCQSCGMPMSDSSVFGTEKSGEKNKEYCIYCYQDGKFKQPDITMEEMINFCVPFMVEDGMKEEEALAILQKTMPYLKRWRKEEPITQPRFITKEGFTFVGVSTRTNNATEVTPEGKIPEMWSNYYGQQTANRIPNPVDSSKTIALYSDYESDVTGDYDFSIGTLVRDKEELSKELVVKTVPSSTYAVFTTSKGKVFDIVPMAWFEIWKWFETSGVERTYTGDFELYDERCADPDNAQVDIYIAIKQ
ncbi:zinc ribbon domain-containing protein [Heyndrickxia sp. NPDC080065]|uniref:zinc ribbon domain-containing protein n=1 Tax=Heyndrickxia sp. NPDC080065 TaxID=3390568 RepID=UPI003CFF0D58